VPFDGAGADEEPGADVLVAEFFANQSDDVGLLGRELTIGSRLALAGRPARGVQFPGGALGECLPPITVNMWWAVRRR
jgi:hypothetical protein